MLWPKKNSYKEFDNAKKFLRLENSPSLPHNFSNGLSLRQSNSDSSHELSQVGQTVSVLVSHGKMFTKFYLKRKLNTKLTQAVRIHFTRLVYQFKIIQWCTSAIAGKWPLIYLYLLVWKYLPPYSSFKLPSSSFQSVFHCSRKLSLLVIFVRKNPGSITLTFKPDGLSSRRRASENASTPNLEIEYAEACGSDARPTIKRRRIKKVYSIRPGSGRHCTSHEPNHIQWIWKFMWSTPSELYRVWRNF